MVKSKQNASHFYFTAIYIEITSLLIVTSSKLTHHEDLLPVNVIIVLDTLVTTHIVTLQ